MSTIKLIPKKKSDNDSIQSLINTFRQFVNNYDEEQSAKIEAKINKMNENTPDRRKINSERKVEENKNRPTLNLKTRIRGSKVAKNGLKLLKRI